ncbi:MAG: glycosyltransferase [Oscillatoriales cyanobacterium]|nr:MAG: glycosyltransferase [Oscillatoriales cyanobacterium]
MRLTVIAVEIPYPANHGGRIDIWRRIKALRALGVEVQLIFWSRQPPDAATVAMIQAQVTEFHRLRYPQGKRENLRRLWDLCVYPLEVTSRIVRGPQWQQLYRTVAAFQPDVVMADHVHCGVVAEALSQALSVPMIVRSHNIEHLHYRDMLAAAPNLKSKVRRFFSQNHFERFETRILQRCLAFYDISSVDLQFWRARGFRNGHLLPPLIELPELPAEPADQPERLTDSAAEAPYDVVFLGNLRTENNVTGVQWFLDRVLPLLRDQKPEIRVLIAGSEPVDWIAAACDRAANITLLPDPPNALAVYRSARVCIDPVAVGRGVSMKSLDMLAAGRPIVSFGKGTSGLPEAVKGYFRVAPEPAAFAQAILDCLAQPPALPDRDLLMAELGRGSIERFVAQLNGLLLRDRPAVISGRSTERQG